MNKPTRLQRALSTLSALDDAYRTERPPISRASWDNPGAGRDEIEEREQLDRDVRWALGYLHTIPERIRVLEEELERYRTNMQLIGSAALSVQKERK